MTLYDNIDLSHGSETPTSRAAYSRLKPHLATLQADVLAWLKGAADGGTCKEYSATTGRALHACSGRFTELAAKGLIRRTDRRREQSAVWVTVEGR